MNQDDSFAALEKREWSDIGVATTYAKAFASAADMVVPYLVNAVEANTETKVLDLCCGHGNVAAGLIGAGANTTGVDFSKVMLEMARKNVPQIKFVEGDAMNLQFEKDDFDAVTIGFGIPHVPDPIKVFGEVRRVLRTGGRFAFSVWCGPEAVSAMGYVFGAIMKYGHPDIALPKGPGAHDYASRENAFSALEATGFSHCAIKTVDSKWQMSDPAMPFEYFRDGTARGGAMLRAQPRQNLEKIRAAVIQSVLENHGNGPQWTVPIPAAVVSAVAV